MYLQTSVHLTEEYNVLVNSEELIGNIDWRFRRGVA
jgi:hypothetical protein